MSACSLFSSPPQLQRQGRKAASAWVHVPNATPELGHTTALEAACSIAQPAVALLTMLPQLWVPLLLLCASLVAAPVGAEVAGGAMIPNNGDLLQYQYRSRTLAHCAHLRSKLWRLH